MVTNGTEKIMDIMNLNLWFGSHHVLKDISLSIIKNKVTAIIGPSGCGKSTLIRSMNLMNNIYDNCTVQGKIMLKGKNILERNADILSIRKEIGMVFQKPNPFPKSIFNNVAYGPKVHRMAKSNGLLERIVADSLKASALWDEVSNRLDESAMTLSGGQQQRLCIARALAVKPEIILMDEPCSALDPLATNKIEDLINQLKKNYTVIIVTHNMQQAARVSDYTAFLYLGELIEYGDTKQIFENPRNQLTEKYITGRFG